MSKIEEIPAQLIGLTRHLRIGQYKRPCPLCQHTRQKNRNDRPLSIIVDTEGVKYSCHHCGEEGGYVFSQLDGGTLRAEPRIKPINLAEPSKTAKQSAREYLAKRGIVESVIEAHTVQTDFQFNGHPVPAVGFPYRMKGETVAIKWRSADDKKAFSQQNVCQDFFLLETYEKGNDILICEGEIDALAWLSSGVPDNLTVLSIPNGAPAKVKDGKVDPKDDKKFRYLYRAKQAIDSAPRIFLNTDNDGPGRALAEEIMRRIDRKKLWTVDLGDYKDAADALVGRGPDYLAQALADSTPVPMIGLHAAEDFCDQFQELYDGGLPKGLSTGIATLDRYFTVVPGMVTITTGFPGSGKSDLVDQICLNLAKERGHKTIYCSFEKPVELHLVQLAEKLVGRPFFKGRNMRMSPEERDYAVGWLNEHFMFMDYRNGGPSDIDGILEAASAAVMRMGCRILVVDPYNYIDVDRHGGGLETDIISDMLTKVQQWAKQHQAHVFFIAHPKSVSRDHLNRKCIVTGHDIAKSAAWFAKADFGLTVWRDMEGSAPSEAHIWKVKWGWMGKMGYTALDYDPVTSRWTDINHDDDEFDWDDF